MDVMRLAEAPAVVAMEQCDAFAVERQVAELAVASLSCGGNGVRQFLSVAVAIAEDKVRRPRGK